MKRGRSTGNPTQAQAQRFAGIVRCICCVMNQRRGVPTTAQGAERHHLTEGGKHGQRRRGHDETVGLCPWHHRSVPPEGHTHRTAAREFGPSYALQPRHFRDHFGHDDTLLILQNQLIEWGLS